MSCNGKILLYLSYGGGCRHHQSIELACEHSMCFQFSAVYWMRSKFKIQKYTTYTQTHFSCPCVSIWGLSVICLALLLYRVQASMLPITVISSSMRHTGITPAIIGTTILLVLVNWLLVEGIVEYGDESTSDVGDVNELVVTGLLEGVVSRLLVSSE